MAAALTWELPWSLGYSAAADKHVQRFQVLLQDYLAATDHWFFPILLLPKYPLVSWCLMALQLTAVLTHCPLPIWKIISCGCAMMLFSHISCAQKSLSFNIAVWRHVTILYTAPVLSKLHFNYQSIMYSLSTQTSEHLKVPNIKTV